MTGKLFDAEAFAAEVAAAVAASPSLRQAAAEAGVSASTLSRVCHADPHTSHENVLRLRRWLAAQTQEHAA